MSDKSSASGGLGRLPSASLLLVWALVVLEFGVGAKAQPAAPPGFGSQTRAQIEAIQDEKAARSPAFRKLDSQLIYALRRQRFGSAVASARALKPAVQFDADGRISVDVDAEIRPELLQFIKQQGGQVLSQYPRYRTFRATVPLALVETLAARPDVRTIQPAVPAHTRAGTVVSEGDVAHQANVFRADFLLGGAGVKIGVLSDSATYYDESQSRGELSAVTILPGEFGNGTGEGTAMMEIIHDLAPDSELYFATAFGSGAGFADNIRRLYQAGCRVIVDDVIYFNESPFQDGIIAQAVNEVSAGGALYFSSAGNEGNLTHNTAGTWEGDFNDGGPVSIGRGGRVHSFGGSEYNTVIPGGGFRRLDLFWADPLGQSTNDYDLYVLDANGNVVRSSTNLQNGQQDPYEWIGTLNDGERVVIVKYAGVARFLHLSAFRGRLAFVTAGSTRGHNASGAPNAFCVAATEAFEPPTAFVGGAVNPVESFSSDGPRRMFFHPDGQPITPGDFSSTGGLALQKPDLTAADGVATSVFRFEQFYGTSAAAPHAAAIAALIWSYNPALTPEEIRTALTAGALDIEAAGWDRDSGAGIPVLPLMMNFVPAPTPKLVMEGIQMIDADGNGALDVNECAEIHVVLRNLIGTNGSAATGVTAVLTGETTGVFVQPIPLEFPDVPPGGLATNTLPFRISSGSTYACWKGAVLRLQVNSDNAGSYLFPISISAMTNGVGQATAFVATNLPLPIPDTGTLEATVSVQDFPFELAEVTVSLHAQHSYDSDLHMSLVAPDGTEVVLSANRGGSGENFGTSCGSRTVFSDRASNSIVSGTAPFVGTFKPDAPLSVLWGRSGLDVNGAWTLKVTDGVESDTGTLLCWTLSLAPIICREVDNPCLVPPAMVQTPGHQVATNGDSVQFTATATGTEPLTYIWLFNETNTLPGITGATLSLTNLLPEQAGTYTVVVSNFYGTATSPPAQLTVFVRPFITMPPSDRVATNGGNVVFAVAAGGTEPLAYQWLFDETNALPEGTSPTLVLTNISAAQGGSYKVRVDNAVGTVLSAPALLTVLVGPAIASEPADVVATNGALVRLEVVASGSAPLSYQWWFDETNAVAGATGPVLELAAITPGQAGLYAVTVSNAVGVVRSRSALVTVHTRPAIVSGPVDLVTTNGALVELAVVASGSAPLEYQWYFAVTNLAGPNSTVLNETNALAGATNATLMLSNVSPAAAGLYAVVVSNFMGSVTSAPALLTVLVGPEIEVEPSDVVATNGELVRLEVVASGSAPLSYQWWFDETNAVAGATGSFLELAAITPAQGGLYAVAVSNAVGVVRSRSAVVTVLSAPFITMPPSDVVATNGDLVALTVTASGSAPLEYQWWFQTTNALAVATNATLVLSNVSPAAAGLYAVVVSNFMGSVTSAPALLTVLVGAGIEVEPADVVATNGALVRLEVVASGSAPLSYQWWFDETNAVAGVTGPVLELTAITPGQAGLYAVAVSNAVGVVRSRSAVVTVLSAPFITMPPSDVVATNGDLVALTVTASGSAPLEYQWWFETTNVLVEATNATLVLSNVSPTVAGLYAVVVSNFIGSVTSAPALLTVLVGPGIEVEPSDVVATNGDLVRLEVVAGGSAPLSYQWWFEETNAVAGATGPSLELTTITSAQAGLYAVAVSNAVGVVRSRSAVVTVLSAPFITMPPSDVVATNGDLVALTVTASGSAPLEYQWWFQTTNVLAEATNATLVLSNVSPAVAGSYAVVVSNFIGSVTSAPALLAVLVPPVIEVEPLDLVATNGDLVRLEVVASGSAPLSYQWWLDETNAVAGASGPVLELTAITPGQAGIYEVTVSNAVGVVRSRSALVTVLAGPQIHTQPENLSVADGATAEFVVVATGIPAPGYQWYFVTTNLLPGQTSLLPNPTNALARATNATLVLSNVNLAAAGSYAVVVSNFIGSVTSAPALLAVLAPPAIEVQPLDSVATNGDLVRLEVVASGSAPLSYQWWLDETNAVAGATASFLELAAITPAQAGLYAVVVTNAVGTVRSRSALVTVFFPPQIHTQPQNVAVSRGTTAEYAVGATGLPVPDYQWFFNVTNSLQAETNAVLVRTNAQAADVGSYQVQVSNALGVVTSSVALLRVGDPPTIVAQPQNLTIRSGQTAAFHVQGSSSLPLDYYWYFESTNLVSISSGTTLLLTNVMPVQSGPYHAVVTNAFGASTSQTAVLRVLVPGSITDFARTGHASNLTFSTVPGLRYTVEYSINLAPTGWFRVSGASKVLATGEFMTIQDSAATNAYRFYRVLVE